MKTNLEKAKELLKSDGYTCVLCKDNSLYTSYERGVKPLLQFLENGIDLNGFSAADKVVGKATAMLYVLANVKEVYAPVMSRGAVQVFHENKIDCFCDETVDAIINRKGDGFCPMETAVKDISSLDLALLAIKEKLKTL